MTRSFTPETLLTHLLTALGLGSAAVCAVTACGGIENGPATREHDAATRDPQDDANAMGGAAGSMGGAGGTGGDPGGGAGGIPPIPPPPPTTIDCTGVTSRAATVDDGCFPELVDAGRSIEAYRYVCFPAAPDGGTCAHAFKSTCGAARPLCWNTYIACGPFAGEADACCYIAGCLPPPPGRPFTVAGKARVAMATSDATWTAGIQPDTAGIDGATRAALAEYWTEEALTEHASVASFSRFVLQCLSLGAPADIVADAQRACADEIDHARIGFGLASAYAGRPVGPGVLDIAHALDDSLDPVDIARSVAAEGCVAELVSAAILGAARDDAGDPAVKAALAKMAEDELMHATLAWRYVRWAFAHGGDRQRRAVLQVFAEMERHVAFGARTARPICEERLRAHGYVPWEERRRIAHSVLTSVVRPAAEALRVAAERTAGGLGAEITG